MTAATIAPTGDTRIHNAGDVAWATAIPRVEMVQRNGTRTVMNPRWTTVWEKRGGWLIVHKHFSMVPPFGPSAVLDAPSTFATQK